MLDDPSIQASDLLESLLHPRIAHFKANPARIVGNDGSKTDLLAAVVYTGTSPSSGEVGIDGVAAVIDAYEDLTLDNLRIAYGRAQAVKSFQKRIPKDIAFDETAIAMTTYIVFARSSSLSLDEISSEMARLNAGGPCETWPDLVAVDRKGLVNYTTRVPGESMSGDFFLPVGGYAPASMAPLYITKTIRASGEHTFNKVVALVCGRLGILEQGLQVAKYDTGLAGLSVYGITTEAYQFDLSGQLRLVTEAQQLDQYVAPDTYNIIVGKETVGSVQFQKWQDGGVFIVRGKFPLEPFLIFLRMQVPSLTRKDLAFVRRPSIQVSNVLRITEQDFLKTLELFQGRTSGMKIVKDSRQLLMTKLADEGTNSPFYARLMLGIFKVRDMVLDDRIRAKFEKAYEPTLSMLTSARDHGRDLIAVWEAHRDKIASGELVQRSGNQIQITDNIDRKLKREFEGFINAAARTMKQCMQNLSSQLGADIGFLFKKEGAFLSGVEALRSTDPELAAYLAEVRKWSEPLMHIRNVDLEHGLGSAFAVRYDVQPRKIEAHEPQLRGEAITSLIGRIQDRLNCFVEEVTVHHLQKSMAAGITVAESDVAGRSADAPERFRVTASIGGLPKWSISPHQRRFEDS